MLKHQELLSLRTIVLRYFELVWFNFLSKETSFAIVLAIIDGHSLSNQGIVAVTEISSEIGICSQARIVKIGVFED